MRKWNIAVTALSAVFLCFAASLGAHHAGPPDQVSSAVQRTSVGESGSGAIDLCISIPLGDPGWDCTT
jgi:hypothetical protein